MRSIFELHFESPPGYRWPATTVYQVGDLREKDRSRKNVESFDWDILDSLLSNESTGPDSVPTFKEFLRKTVEGGVKTARDETIRNEISRLWGASWMVLGWLGWIDLLRRERPHICFDLQLRHRLTWRRLCPWPCQAL